RAHGRDFLLCSYRGLSLGYGWFDVSLFESSLRIDPAGMSDAASSRETRAISQATHDSPRSSTPLSVDGAGASESPLRSAASAAFVCPSCQCAIARTAQAFAGAKRLVLFAALSPQVIASRKCPSRYFDMALHAWK